MVCRSTCAVIVFPCSDGQVVDCHLGVVGDAVLDRVAAELAAAAGREQRLVRVGALSVEPVTQDGDGDRGERGDPVLAALAVTGDVRARAEVQVGAGEPDQFGDPQPGLDGEQQQRVVASAGPRVHGRRRPAARRPRLR